MDAHHCTDPSKYISVLLLSLQIMLQLGLPHVNVLSKVDLMESYGKLGNFKWKWFLIIYIYIYKKSYKYIYYVICNYYFENLFFNIYDYYYIYMFIINYILLLLLLLILLLIL